MNTTPKTILVAPLNWGLGHATRCIPIIKALQVHNYIPIIASDGSALELLKKEFPELQFLTLPSYQIEYADKSENFKWKLIKNSPNMIEAVWEEKQLVKKWIKIHKIDGLISDNRLGVFSKRIPSVFLTHQLNVLTGNTTWITSKIHQFIISKYTECWVPDVASTPNLSGILGHLNTPKEKIKYIGSLSRMTKKILPLKYDLMIVLSGPEPQRSLLEEKLIQEIEMFEGKIVFIKGIVEEEQIKEKIENVTYYNFMNTKQLAKTFNQSNKIICRSGYSTIMDIVKLEKKAFLIPTPGQYEQEYLAQKFKTEGLFPSKSQDKFKLKDLKKINFYDGFKLLEIEKKWESIFQVFEIEMQKKTPKNE